MPPMLPYRPDGSYVTRTLAYLADANCAALPGGDPKSVLNTLAPMTSQGDLLCGAADGMADRLVRPYVFIGRTGGGRLTYICEVLSL